MAYVNLFHLKRWIVTGLLLSALIVVQAQNRQIKMYLEHIAAGKVYIEYLQKGYSIVRQGLGVISDIKNGHLKLDQLFFNGLVAINPKIRQYPHVADVMRMAVKITGICTKTQRLLATESGISADMRTYAIRVTTGLSAGCLALLSDLADLLMSNNLQLSDDERIRRIDLVYAEMTDRYEFIEAWSAETSVMILQMRKERLESERMKNVHGIK